MLWSFVAFSCLFLLGQTESSSRRKHILSFVFSTAPLSTKGLGRLGDWRLYAAVDTVVDAERWICGSGPSQMEMRLPLTEDIACLLWDGCRPFSSRSHRRKVNLSLLPHLPPDLEARLALMSMRWQTLGPHCLGSAWEALLAAMHCANLGSDLERGRQGTNKKPGCWSTRPCPG